MVTEDAKNLKVIGVKGNFDDTQHTLKELLSSEDFKAELKERNIKLSAANSVNFGRIIFQIIYHIHSYLEMVRNQKISMGEKIYLVVPSGNFGNALGGYYAKKAGLPIEKILIASNINNILTDWINTGSYDISNRELILTQSPAMDILKSSNIERVMFDKFGAKRTKELMEALSNDGKYQLTDDELKLLQEDFVATFSNDEEGEEIIAKYAKKGYIMDPHTATCMKAYDELREKDLPTVIYSTAEWTKFSSTVSKSLGHEVKDDIEALKWVKENANVSIVPMITGLFDKPIVHDIVVDKKFIKGEMLNFL
jgi:threonine synthase